MAKVVATIGRPRLAPGIPEPPAHVAGLAADEWQRVAGVLVARGDMDAGVLGMLEVYAINYARWREAEAHLAEFGTHVPAPRTGIPMENPNLRVSNAAAALMLRMAKAMGVMP